MRKGKTPVLDPAETRALLDSIDFTTSNGLRDLALIALMVFSLGRIGAALAMQVEDVFVQNRRLWLRLREKGGKQHEMPCHHTLDEYLHAHLDGTEIANDPKGPLFRTVRHGDSRLTRTKLLQANAYAMVRRRALVAGIETRIGNHSFRATGIIAYLTMAARSRTRRRWPTMPVLAPRTYMTDGATTSAWMKWNTSGCRQTQSDVSGILGRTCYQ